MLSSSLYQLFFKHVHTLKTLNCELILFFRIEIPLFCLLITVGEESDSLRKQSKTFKIIT